MKYIKLKEPLQYDGSQIEPMWTFKQFEIKESNIVAWIGPMDIKPQKLIDYEDVGLEIKSDEMVHFIIEHFDCQPADIKTCYHRQRLLVLIVKDLLSDFGIKTQRNGDDIYYDDGKLSVSIATCSNSSMKIHFGMNLTSNGTPSDVSTIGLLECGNDMDYQDISNLMDEICKNYINEMESIEKDITKTKVF